MRCVVVSGAYRSESQAQIRTLIVKAIDTVDTCALVVPPQDEEVLWVLDLVCEEQADRLERLLATVHVITQEKVVCFWWEAAILEQAQKVVVLTVDVA